jgi:hypothetical protein
MTDFLPGDLIDVTYRGVVRHAPDVDYVTLDLTPSGYVDLFISAATTINVVQKRSPQVGDTLLGSVIKSSTLPVGSVLRSATATWMRAKPGWYSSDGTVPVVLDDDSFTVLALPA